MRSSDRGKVVVVVLMLVTVVAVVVSRSILPSSSPADDRGADNGDDKGGCPTRAILRSLVRERRSLLPLASVVSSISSFSSYYYCCLSCCRPRTPSFSLSLSSSRSTTLLNPYGRVKGDGVGGYKASISSSSGAEP